MVLGLYQIVNYGILQIAFEEKIVMVLIATKTTQDTQCLNCGSSRFINIASKEECKRCGYYVSYSGSGTNQIALDCMQEIADREAEEYERYQQEFKEEFIARYGYEPSWNQMP